MGKPKLKNNEFKWLFLIALLAILISLVNVWPVLYKDNIVQDDFRQSYFWVWKFWDPGLLEKSFFINMYQSHLIRTPLLNLIFHLGPYITDNLIFFSKLMSIFVSTISIVFAYLFFNQLTKDKVLILTFTIFMGMIFWYTDHVPNGCTRSFLWAGLYAYMYFKSINKDKTAALTIFTLLLTSPFTFLLCYVMEFYNFIFSLDLKLLKESIKKNLVTLYSLTINGLSVSFLYLVLFKDIKTQAVGQTFSLEEMKSIPEFNIHGRHDIFSTIKGEHSWIHSRHWGLPLGEITPLEITSIFIGLGLIVLYFLLVKKNKKEILTRGPIILLYSSVTLYIAAQVLFPLLFMPNRYITVPWLLLVLLVPFLLFNDLINYLKEKKARHQNKGYAFAILTSIIILCISWPIRNPSYVIMDLGIKKEINKLPMDSIIAAHPQLLEISMIPIVNKRAVFVDSERSIAYSRKELEEIRRRTKIAFKMVYSSNLKEIISLMEENDITHFIAHKRFYTKKKLDKPWYYRPYNQHLRTVIRTNRDNGYFFDKLLSSTNKKFMLLSLEDLKNQLK